MVLSAVRALCTKELVVATGPNELRMRSHEP